jgi:molybdopterin converting factor small subunit
MKVKIKLFATLRKFGPDEQEVELPDGATVEDAVELLNLPEKMPLLKIVNGEHRPPKHPLKDGDELALFPPIAGGERLGEKTGGLIDPPGPGQVTFDLLCHR